MTSKRFFLFLRGALSLGILYLLLSRVDYGQMMVLLPGLALPYFTLGLLLFLLDRVLMSHRWQVLLKAGGTSVPLMEIVRLYFMTSFLGMFVPSSLAPDAMRAYLATKYDGSPAFAVSSVFVDRFIGFLTLAAVALGSCAVLAWSGESEILTPAMIVVILAPFAALVGWLIFHNVLWRLLEHLSTFSAVARIHRFLLDFYRAMTSYRQKAREVLRVAGLCFVNHLLFILVVYTMSLSLHLDVFWVHLCIFVPLVTFVTLVPVSVGGLGVQEGAYVYLLMRSGLSVQEAFAVALLVRVVTTIGCLPGGLLYLSRGFQVRQAVE